MSLADSLFSEQETSGNPMMEDKLNRTDMNERHGRSEKKSKFQDSNAAAPKSPVKVNTVGAQTGMHFHKEQVRNYCVVNNSYGPYFQDL